MITFPEEFVPTKVMGYFWSKTEQKLYSIKGGQLKVLVGPVNLATQKGYFTGWVVSHLGERVYLSLKYLTSLNDDSTHHELPVIRTHIKKKRKSSEYIYPTKSTRYYRYNQTNV